MKYELPIYSTIHNNLKNIMLTLNLHRISYPTDIATKLICYLGQEIMLTFLCIIPVMTLGPVVDKSKLPMKRNSL